jgi:hypothetical protein
MAEGLPLGHLEEATTGNFCPKGAGGLSPGFQPGFNPGNNHPSRCALKGRQIDRANNTE